MKNLEGIKLSEIKESKLEKKSITINDDYNFDDCVLTEKERLEKFKQDLVKFSAEQKNSPDVDYDEDYEDCRKNGR